MRKLVFASLAIILALLTLLFPSLIAPPVSASTPIGSVITSDTTWTKASSPYIVTSSVLVSEGVTLTIEPGVVVRFDSARGMQIEGQLIAQATEAEPIVFTSNQLSPASGDWINILFTDTSVDATYDGEGNYLSGCIMQYCKVEYGGGSDLPTLRIVSSSPFIDHCTVTNNAYVGIYVGRYSSSKITNNTISYNSGSVYGGGIRCYAGSPTISANNITNNSAYYGGGICCYGSATISANNITNNSVSSAYGYGGGICCTGGSPIISANNISSNSAPEGGGIYCDGTPTISYNQITGNSVSGGKGGGICIRFGQPTINYNDIYNNTPHDVYNSKSQGSPHVNATNNWWGTTDEATIQAHIYDWFDDGSLGIVDYIPYLTSVAPPPPTPTPTDTTGPTLDSVTWTDVDASNTINTDDTLRFNFSEAMDTTTITAANIDIRLPTSPSHTYGGLTVADLSWNTAKTQLTVTLGVGETIVGGETVNPAASVTDVAGNADATTYPGPAISTPTDTTGPALDSVTWTDVDDSGTINEGDTLRFNFSEAMDTDTIIAANIDARLPTYPSHTYGGLTAADLSWNTAKTRLTVTLGAGETIVGGETVNPAASVTDVAGNADATTAPGPAIPMPVAGAPTVTIDDIPSEVSEVPEVTGDATASSGRVIQTVEVRIRRTIDTTYRYWTSSTWTSTSNTWIDAEATDGAFDERTEDWEIAAADLPDEDDMTDGATYRIEAKAQDNQDVWSPVDTETFTYVKPSPTPTPTPAPAEGCFIATAAYGTSTASELDILRAFRDEVLLQNNLGSRFVALYYEVSPPLADFISEHQPLRTLVRELLVDPVVWVVEATAALWRD